MPNLSQLQFTAYLKVFDFVQPLCFHLYFLYFPPLLPSSLISFLSLPAHASLPSVPSNSSPHSPSIPQKFISVGEAVLGELRD